VEVARASRLSAVTSVVEARREQSR
jgi:hypothetical protein